MLDGFALTREGTVDLNTSQQVQENSNQYDKTTTAEAKETPQSLPAPWAFWRYGQEMAALGIPIALWSASETSVTFVKKYFLEQHY